MIENKHQDYEIRELTCRKEAGSIRLRWRYRKAEEFLIFLYDSRRLKEPDLETVCGELAAVGAEDVELLGSGKKMRTVGKDRGWQLLHMDKAEFLRAGRCCCLSAHELDKEVPYGICVFACSFDPEKQELHLYPSDMQENTCFLPVKVRAEIRYRTRLFSKEKYCILRLPQIADYADGAIQYRADDSAFDIPLPHTCLGRELIISLPKQSRISLRVREAEKKYLAIQVSECKMNSSDKKG